MATLKTGLGPIITFLNTICDHPDLFEPFVFIGSAEDHLSSTYVIAVGNEEYVNENYSGLGGILFDESPNKHRRRSRPRDLVLYKIDIRVFATYVDTLEQGDKELVEVKSLVAGALKFVHNINWRELRNSTKLKESYFPWVNLSRSLGDSFKNNEEKDGAIEAITSFSPPIAEYFNDWSNLFEYYVEIPCDYEALCLARNTSAGCYTSESNNPFAFVSEASSFSYKGGTIDPYDVEDFPKYSWVLTNSWQMYYQEICSLEEHVYIQDNGEQVREVKNWFPISKFSNFDIKGAKIDATWLNKIRGRAFTDIDVLSDEAGNVSLRGMLAKRYTFFVSNRNRYLSQGPTPSSIRRVVYQSHPSFDPDYLSKDVVSVPGLTMARFSASVFDGKWKKPTTWFKVSEGNLYGLLITIELDITHTTEVGILGRRRRSKEDASLSPIYTYTYTASAVKLANCSRDYNKRNGHCGPALNEKDMLKEGEDPTHICYNFYTGTYVTDEEPCDEFFIGCMEDGTIRDDGSIYRTIYFQGRCMKLLLEAIKSKDVSLWVTLQGHHRIAWPDKESTTQRHDYPRAAPMTVTDDTCDITMGGLSYFFMPTRHIFHRELLDGGVQAKEVLTLSHQ